MLSSVIDYINTQLGTLNMYEKTHSLCDLITNNDITFPAEYCNGEYKSAVEFTNYQGVVYHRLDGNIRIEQSNEESSTGCGIYTKKTYPMRSVFCVKKRQNAYSQEEMINNIEVVISGQNIKSVADAVGMENVSIELNGAITDRDKLYQDEQKTDNKVGFEFAYFAVLYDVIIEGDLSCQTLISC